MATPIRPKDIATTATTEAADDYYIIDGATNGTRKIAAGNAAKVALAAHATDPAAHGETFLRNPTPRRIQRAFSSGVFTATGGSYLDVACPEVREESVVALSLVSGVSWPGFTPPVFINQPGIGFRVFTNTGDLSTYSWAVLPSRPQVTISASHDTSLTQSWEVADTTPRRCLRFTYGVPVSAVGNSDVVYSHGCAFFTSAPVFEVQVSGWTSACVADVFISGELVSRIAGPDNSTAARFLKVATREYGVCAEVIFSEAVTWAGITTHPDTYITKSPPRRRIAVVGDSVAAGQGCAHRSDGWAYVLGDALGADVVSASIPGTGVAFDANDKNYQQRFADDVGAPGESWNAIVLQASTNDSNLSSGAIAAGWSAYLDQVRARFPQTPIFVRGYTPSVLPVGYEDALEVLVVARADKRMRFIRTQELWASGSAIGGAHPNTIGQRLMGEYTAAQIATA